MTTKALVQIEHPQRRDPEKPVLSTSFSGDNSDALSAEWSQLKHVHLEPHSKRALDSRLKVLEAEMHYQLVLNEESRISPVKRWLQEQFMTDAYIKRWDRR